MYKKQQEKSYLEATGILFLIFKWKKPLLLVSIVALVCSSIFSGERFITPKYKSVVILFPASTSSISKAIIEDIPGEKQDILAFGEEEQAEQLLQILNSSEIRNHIADKYHLIEHYGIDPHGDYPNTYLENDYNDNITFQRTEFTSIRIEVLDADPQMAADIANDIASFSDSLRNKMIHVRAMEAVKIIEDECKEKRAEIQRKQDSVQMIQRLGIYDFLVQDKVLNEEYGKASTIYTSGVAALPVLEKYRGDGDTTVINTRARVKGAEAQLKALDAKLAVFAKYGSVFSDLKDDIYRGYEQLNKLQIRGDRVRADADENVTHKFIVNNAVKAEKKSYPIRWLVVLVCTLSGFLFALLVIMGIEKYNHLKAIN